MQVAEQPPEAKETPAPCREEHARYPRIFESSDDSAIHVLVVAALSAFVVYVLGEGVGFRDTGTLALTVFFAMSIAGAVLGGRRVASTAQSNPKAISQPGNAGTREIATGCPPCAPEPQRRMAQQDLDSHPACQSDPAGNTPPNLEGPAPITLVCNNGSA